MPLRFKKDTFPDEYQIGRRLQRRPLLVFGASMLFAPQWTIDAAAQALTPPVASPDSLAGLDGCAVHHRCRIGSLALRQTPAGRPTSPDKLWGVGALLLCTLLAGGGVFWSAAEPLYHFQTLPPVFDDVVAKTAASVRFSTMPYTGVRSPGARWHCLSAIVLMVGEELHGLPLRPRSSSGLSSEASHHNGWASSSTQFRLSRWSRAPSGPLDFGIAALECRRSTLRDHGGAASQLGVLVALVVVFTLSAISGIDRGIASSLVSMSHSL